MGTIGDCFHEQEQLALEFPSQPLFEYMVAKTTYCCLCERARISGRRATGTVPDPQHLPASSLAWPPFNHGRRAEDIHGASVSLSLCQSWRP
jgi:hypothetical protein